MHAIITYSYKDNHHYTTNFFQACYKTPPYCRLLEFADTNAYKYCDTSVPAESEFPTIVYQFTPNTCQYCITFRRVGCVHNANLCSQPLPVLLYVTTSTHASKHGRFKFKARKGTLSLRWRSVSEGKIKPLTFESTCCLLAASSSS